MIYIILVSVLLCCIGFIVNKNISTKEFFILCATAVGVSLVSFFLTCIPFPNDTYYMSGKINQVQYHPAFTERYTYVVIRKVGKTTVCTTRTAYDYHSEYWKACDSLNHSHRISKEEYDEMCKEFGNNEQVKHDARFNHMNGNCVEGDSNLYYYNNETNSYRYPTTVTSMWFNPIKRRQSLFNTENNYREYPKRYDWRLNDRLSFPNGIITKEEFDRFNTKLYEQIKCNVVLIKVKDIDDLNKIKLAWNNGKKNDIIIAIVGDIAKPTNVKVFGWYKEEILSTTLESDILDNGVVLGNIYSIILTYYIPFDFKQFSYLQQPTLWQYIFTIITTLLCLLTLYVICHKENL